MIWSDATKFFNALNSDDARNRENAYRSGMVYPASSNVSAILLILSLIPPMVDVSAFRNSCITANRLSNAKSLNGGFLGNVFVPIEPRYSSTIFCAKYFVDLVLRLAKRELVRFANIGYICLCCSGVNSDILMSKFLRFAILSLLYMYYVGNVNKCFT